MRIPNVFVQQACQGSRHAAERAWTRPLGALNGCSPAEAWDKPALIMSAEDLAANPEPGPLALSTMRARIIRVVQHESSPLRVTDLGAGYAPDMRGLVVTEPEADVVEEAISFASDDVLPFGAPVPQPANGNGATGAVSSLLEDIRRRRARHNGRPVSSFRGRF